MADDLLARARPGGGLRTDVTVRGHALVVDEPPSVGGDDAGPMPTELLAAALASCFCLALVHVAGKRDVALPGLEVVVGAVRAGRELRYGRFVVRVRADADDAVLAPLLERARAFCWVSNTLAEPPDIDLHPTPHPTPAEAP